MNCCAIIPMLFGPFNGQVICREAVELWLMRRTVENSSKTRATGATVRIVFLVMYCIPADTVCSDNLWISAGRTALLASGQQMLLQWLALRLSALYVLVEVDTVDWTLVSR